MKQKILFTGIIIVAAALLFMVPKIELWSETAVQEPVAEAAALPKAEPRYPYAIEAKSTFASTLRELDVSAQDIFSIVTAAKPFRNLGQLHPGIRFELLYADREPAVLNGIRIKFSPREVLLVEKSGATWTAQKIEKKVETRVTSFKGEVKSSLWESATEAKMNPALIAELAEIFAWQVDFSREVQPGDRWRLSVEEELVAGQHVGWGSILSAEYIKSGETYTAVLFRDQGEDVGYFAPDGSSLKRIFLKSPIQYGRISSRFNRKRFHPVLKVARPHNGVDYAAPTGTPIRSVGEGRVFFIGRSGGGGNVITIRHNSTYTTSYKHLSRFAKGMRRGSTVKQGQTIGYVGSTGMSTGAHLHFEFFVNGRYVDPLGQKFPTAEPVPRNLIAQFLEAKDGFYSHLPDWENPAN